MKREDGKGSGAAIDRWAQDPVDPPFDDGRSQELFELVMAKLRQQERRRRWLLQVVGAIAAAATSAGAYRLLTH